MDEHNIATMLDAYIACALWSSTDESRDDGGDPLDDNYAPSHLAPETLEAMRTDVESFARANVNEIDGAYSQAGHDLWLTRNGHGAGFWDGDWPGWAGEKLTEASHAMGERHLYIGDDGRIYQT